MPSKELHAATRWTSVLIIICAMISQEMASSLGEAIPTEDRKPQDVDRYALTGGFKLVRWLVMSLSCSNSAKISRLIVFFVQSTPVAANPKCPYPMIQCLAGSMHFATTLATIRQMILAYPALWVPPTRSTSPLARSSTTERLDQYSPRSDKALLRLS